MGAPRDRRDSRKLPPLAAIPLDLFKIALFVEYFIVVILNSSYDFVRYHREQYACIHTYIHICIRTCIHTVHTNFYVYPLTHRRSPPYLCFLQACNVLFVYVLFMNCLCFLIASLFVYCLHCCVVDALCYLLPLPTPLDSAAVGQKERAPLMRYKYVGEVVTFWLSRNMGCFMRDIHAFCTVILRRCRGQPAGRDNPQRPRDDTGRPKPTTPTPSESKTIYIYIYIYMYIHT